MRSITINFALGAVSTAFLIGVASLAFAQTATSASATAEATTSEPLSKTEQKKQAKAQAKAQHKAERKAARAKNTAELKKLEDAGYKPAQNDPNYPQNLQNAQKKANAAAGASQ